MSDALVRMLKEQKEVYGFQQWVVPNPIALEPYSENNVSRIFRKIKVAANLPSRLQLRDIRRTVLTDLANHGATDTEIMAYSGHKSRESLMPYVCINTEQARNAANKRQFNILTNDRSVSVILWMDSYTGVTQHRLRPSGCNYYR